MAHVTEVRTLLFPRTVAVVGASPRRAETIATTVRSGVTVWGVNPGRDEVAGVRCFPTVADLPERPDVAFVLVGHERVEAAVADALAAGVRAFVVPGIGAEAGSEGPKVTARLARAVRDADALMIGPNCMGVYVPDGPSTWIGEQHGSTASGHVAVVSQSGSIADAFLSLGGRIGLRCVVSSGSEAVTDAADLLRFFAADDGTRAVGVFLEAVRRPDVFAAALADCAEAGKPVVCLKVGRSEAAARAAATHTGALVGSGRAFSALLRRHGALEVDDFQDLTETLELLGRRRWPMGVRLGAISESGGECGLFADQAELAGIPFAPLPIVLAATLKEEFPNFTTPGNPLDVFAIAPVEEVYPRSLELLAESGAFDGLLGLVDLSQFRDPGDDLFCELTIRTLARLADVHDMFVASATIHGADPPPRFQELSRELDVPLLRGARTAMRAVARVARWRPAPAHRDDGVVAPAVADLLTTGAMPEHESALVLERYGIPFAARRRAATPEDAATAATELGLPVVVKRDGPAHKARDGGVVLGVDSAEAAAAAALRLGGPVLVARQVAGAAEALCGMTRDPQYGPVLVVGAGGSDVETVDRVVATLAPIDVAAAAELVADAGVEDPHGVVALTLVSLGRLALAEPRIESVDVNPLVVGAEATVAVDALVVVS
jgi:acetyltransferase